MILGLRDRITSFEQLRQAVVIALAYIGTPQLEIC
jgi:hypothetical protein